MKEVISQTDQADQAGQADQPGRPGRPGKADQAGSDMQEGHGYDQPGMHGETLRREGRSFDMKS